MEQTMMHGNAYSNLDYLPINFQSEGGWRVQESHYHNEKMEDIPIHNGDCIHTNAYETPVYFDLIHPETREHINCVVTVRKYDTQVVEYGNPRIGSNIIITYEDEKTTSICAAYYKDHPTDKVLKKVITGAHLECLGRKHIVHFNSKENLVQQLNKAFWAESCYIEDGKIMIRMPKSKDGSYRISIRNGNGMRLLKAD